MRGGGGSASPLLLLCSLRRRGGGAGHGSKGAEAAGRTSDRAVRRQCPQLHAPDLDGRMAGVRRSIRARRRGKRRWGRGAGEGGLRRWRLVMLCATATYRTK